MSTVREDLEAAFLGRTIVLIGAGALASRGLLRGRETLDLDYAIDIDVDELMAVANGITGWRSDTRQAQRWHAPDGTLVDLIPMGPSHLASGVVEWPDGVRMGVLGFRYLTGPVASPASVVLLKLGAVDDRMPERIKDLMDIAWLSDDYIGVHDDRAFIGPAADRGLYAEDGSTWTLGRDLGLLVQHEPERAMVRRVLTDVIDPLWTWGPRLAGLMPMAWGADVDEMQRRFALLLRGFNSAVQGDPTD